MTAAAQSFVTLLTFQAISGHLVACDLLDAASEAARDHISLARFAEPFTIGFAAETHDVELHALRKWTDKGLDAIIVNQVGLTAGGLDSDVNSIALTGLFIFRYNRKQN